MPRHRRGRSTGTVTLGVGGLPNWPIPFRPVPDHSNEEGIVLLESDNPADPPRELPAEPPLEGGYGITFIE